jgi:hypothetical protein
MANSIGRQSPQAPRYASAVRLELSAGLDLIHDCSGSGCESENLDTNKTASEKGTVPFFLADSEKLGQSPTVLFNVKRFAPEYSNRSPDTGQPARDFAAVGMTVISLLSLEFQRFAGMKQGSIDMGCFRFELFGMT